jgi:hypothetical protein
MILRQKQVVEHRLTHEELLDKIHVPDPFSSLPIHPFVPSPESPPTMVAETASIVTGGGQ